MMTGLGLIEFVNNYSPAALREECEKWSQIAADKKQRISEATEEYNQAQFTYQLINSALRLREAQDSQESQNGHKPSASPKSSAESETNGAADKTAMTLEILRQADGMQPGVLFKTLIARGVRIQRPYVSTVLQRLKTRDQVYVEDGKYFAK